MAHISLVGPIAYNCAIGLVGPIAYNYGIGLAGPIAYNYAIGLVGPIAYNYAIGPPSYRCVALLAVRRFLANNHAYMSSAIGHSRHGYRGIGIGV